MTFARWRSRCPIPLLRRGAVFESFFDPSPASSSSRPRYRVYHQVAAVESEVADCAAALHRRSKPLSAVLPRKVRRYAVVDKPLFAAPQPVNPSFSRLAGAAAVGSKRWGSVTFVEMERLERLFRCQLVPIPEPQKRALIVTPGSDSSVFSEPIPWFPPP